MKRTVSILLCLLLGISYLPCIGEESYAIETDDDWKYSLTMPEEAYDCVEEVMLYRYNDPIETMSTAETMEGYEPAGKQVISSEAGSWTLAEPEVGEKIIDGDTICEQTVEKKSVCYSFAYTDTVNDWFWLNPDARHYVKYMDEDVVGNHELTGTLPTDEDYAVCVNFLQIFSENDIAGFDNVDDVDSSKYWCAQTQKTITSGTVSGEFGEVYLILYDGEPVDEFVSGSKKNLAYVWNTKDTGNPDVRATEKKVIYRTVTEKYKNVFRKDNWSEWSDTEPENRDNREIESSPGYRFKNKTEQRIEAPSTISKTFGSSSFNIGAKGKTDLTYKSSNTSIASVSSTGQVTLKNPGTAVINVTAEETNAFFGDNVKVTVKSTLKAPSLTAKKASKTSIRLSWTKTGGASGYQIYKYSPSKKRYVKAATKSYKVCATTNKKLKRHRRHYYKIRAYRVVNGKYVYSSFSPVRSVRL